MIHIPYFKSLFGFLLLLFLFSGCEEPMVEQADLSGGTWIDLTHDFSEETLFWPTSDRFKKETVFAGHTDEGFYYESHNFCTAEHGGTHLDAPIHFAESRKTADQIPLDSLIGPAAVINVSDSASANRNYQIRTEDIMAWEETYRTTVDGYILLFNTGFHQHWPDAEAYMGTSKRGEEGVAELSFPGIHPETAQWLVENRSVRAVGLDTPSLDYGKSTTFETHVTLSEQNIPGFENVANLSQIPNYGAFVVALPMKIKDGSGAPLRIVAQIP